MNRALIAHQLFTICHCYIESLRTTAEVSLVYECIYIGCWSAFVRSLALSRSPLSSVNNLFRLVISVMLLKCRWVVCARPYFVRANVYAIVNAHLPLHHNIIIVFVRILWILFCLVFVVILFSIPSTQTPGVYTLLNLLLGSARKKHCTNALIVWTQ